jgi:hypothetical protein
MRNKNLVRGTKSQLENKNKNLSSTEQTTTVKGTIVSDAEKIKIA